MSDTPQEARTNPAPVVHGGFVPLVEPDPSPPLTQPSPFIGEPPADDDLAQAEE